MPNIYISRSRCGLIPIGVNRAHLRPEFFAGFWWRMGLVISRSNQCSRPFDARMQAQSRPLRVDGRTLILPPTWRQWRSADLRSGAFPGDAQYLPGRRPALRGQCQDAPLLDASPRAIGSARTCPRFETGRNVAAEINPKHQPPSSREAPNFKMRPTGSVWRLDA
jgi:hypothetical protein